MKYFCCVTDIFVVTKSVDDMSETFGRLMESLFRVLAAVTNLETYTKTLRIQNEHLNHSKADC
jgi:hypothetical protein